MNRPSDRNITMENIDWNKHYNAFKWAVSKNWKDTNGLHRSIRGKIETLVQEYDLTEREIVDDDSPLSWLKVLMMV